MRFFYAKSFFIRLFFSTLILAIVMVIAVNLIIYEQLNLNYQERSKQNQEQYTRLLLKYFTNAMAEHPAEIDRECKNLSSETRYRVTVIAADGSVLGDSLVSPESMENHKTPNRPEVWNAFNKEMHSDIRHSSTMEVDFRYCAVPVIVDGRVAGIVRTAMPVVTIAQGEGVIRQILLWASVATLIMSAGLGLLISWLWNRPLKEITLAARRLAGGELDQKIHITAGTKELSQLAGSLNEMREKLAGKISQITSQRENLHAVVENLAEGVIALDYDDRIIQLNAAACRLIGIPVAACLDRILQNAVRIPDILDAVSRSRTHNESVRTQIRLDNGNILDVQVYSVHDGGDNDIAVLIVLRDMTEAEKMTAIKSQFVANASHELRTPLATIRAAVDSLKLEGAGDASMFERLLDILDRHTRRLEDMTNDLL
ncbi:MAG TPA: histidine kinase dimerization/phospho-acceptor domain-containing protein, partial [Phycisphaerae bacterium]|nr:histidine kinase dimerization/phospho-acceptor domain-containing protein [Phycisphaerae bacterium]